MSIGPGCYSSSSQPRAGQSPCDHPDSIGAPTAAIRRIRLEYRQVLLNRRRKHQEKRRRGAAAADGFTPSPLDARRRRIPPSSPAPTPRSPAAPTPTHESPAVPTSTPRWPPPPTSTPKSSATDLEEHKGTTELLRAIKNEKANGPDLEEYKGAGELHMESPKSKKRKRSRQSSGKHHGEYEETNKVVMKPSTSKKKRKASEEMCTNPPGALLGPLAVDMEGSSLNREVV